MIEKYEPTSMYETAYTIVDFESATKLFWCFGGSKVIGSLEYLGRWFEDKFDKQKGNMNIIDMVACDFEQNARKFVVCTDYASKCLFKAKLAKAKGDYKLAKEWYADFRELQKSYYLPIPKFVRSYFRAMK